MEVKVSSSGHLEDASELEQLMDTFNQFDISLLLARRLKQEKRNLKKVLAQIDKAQKKSLEMFEYEREQTKHDLEERIKKKSTSFKELQRSRGRRESITESRKECLEIVRAHTRYVWNNAYSLPTYSKKKNTLEEQKKESAGNNQLPVLVRIRTVSSKTFR
ncbi:hypothetical protein ACF0H5_017376 [Mactra antiquata]